MKANYIKNVENILGYLLAFSIFFPILTLQAILKPVKIPFLALGLLLALFIIAAKKSLSLNKAVFFVGGLYLIRGIYGTVSGLLQNAAGVIVVIDLSITYVCVYLLLMTLIRKPKHFNWLVEILFLGTLFVVFLDIYFILNFLDVVPYLKIYDIFQHSPTPFTIGINQYKTVELYARNLGVLAFAFPFMVALLFDKKVSKNIRFINRSTILFLLISSIVLMLICGRRIFILIILVTPIFFFFFTRFLDVKEKQVVNKGLSLLLIMATALVLSLFTYTAINFNLDLESIVNSFIAAFDSNTESIRYEQSVALLNSWWESPIFGHGIGAGIDGFYRSKTRPWAFEMGYHLSLHRLGLLGFAFELFFYLGTIFLGIKIIIKDNDFIMIGLLCGFLGFLLAHATNPFLNSYEYLWPIMLPICYINMKLLNPSNKIKALNF